MNDDDSYRYFEKLMNSIECYYRKDEAAVIRECVDEIDLNEYSRKSIKDKALNLINSIRCHYQPDPLDSLMAQYDLSSDEGIALMCLAEALIRIPDKDKSNQLIKDRLTQPDWVQDNSKGSAASLASFALSFTGSLLNFENSNRLVTVLKQVITKIGEPAIRQSVTLAVKLLGNKFVLGESIDAALQCSKKLHKRGRELSFKR